MTIQTNHETLDKLIAQSALDSEQRRTYGVRIVVNHSCCGGATFGLEVDIISSDDYACVAKGLMFMMKKTLCDKYGDISIMHTPEGYLVKPVIPIESACGDCKTANKSDKKGGCESCTCGN